MSSDAAPAPAVSLTNRWLIVVLLMGYAAIGHFNRVGISVAGTEVFIRQSQEGAPTHVAAGSTEPGVAARLTHVFSETEMGWVYTTFLIVYTVSMLPGGWLIDRFGAARALTWFGLSMGSFVAVTGAVGWLAGTPQQLWIGLLVIRGLAGMCSAPLHPGAAHAVADVTTARGRTTANGLVTAGALLGIALSYPLFGALIDRVSWPWAFVCCGLGMVAYAGVWRVLSAGRLPVPASSSETSTARSRGGEWVRPGNEESSERSSWTATQRRDLGILTLSYVAYGYFQYLFFYWMAYYFERVLHVPEVESRRASFIIALAQGAGMVLGGLSNDVVCRWIGVARGRRAIMLVGMSLSAVFALIAVNLTGVGPVACFMALAMGSQGMCEGIYWSTATDIGGRDRGFAGAFMNTGGNIGGFLSPVLTPMLAEQMGWPAAIGVACVICALGGVVWFGMQPSAEKGTSD